MTTDSHVLPSSRAAVGNGVPARFEEELCLDAEDAKRVIEGYAQAYGGDAAPQDRPRSEPYWCELAAGLLPAYDERAYRSLACRLVALGCGPYPAEVVDVARIPVWRRKCVLESIREVANQDHPDPRQIVRRIASAALDAFLGVPTVTSHPTPYSRRRSQRNADFVYASYPYHLYLSDEKLGVSSAYRRYPELLDCTAPFDRGDEVAVTCMLSDLWRCRLRDRYRERAVEALATDPASWVGLPTDDAETRLSVQCIGLCQRVLAWAHMVDVRAVENPDVAPQLAAIGQGLVDLGLTPSYYDPSAGTWR